MIVAMHSSIKAFNTVVNLGMERNLNFTTPLIWLNEAETWVLSNYYHPLDLVRLDTLTCYNGVRGDDCGQCAACCLCARGLKSYRT